MCAGSSSKLGDKNVSVYMGWHGGSLSVGEAHYTVNPNHKGTKVSEEEMVKLLQGYRSEDLARLLVELVRDSDE